MSSTPLIKAKETFTSRKTLFFTHRSTCHHNVWRLLWSYMAIHNQTPDAWRSEPKRQMNNWSSSTSQTENKEADALPVSQPRLPTPGCERILMGSKLGLACMPWWWERASDGTGVTRALSAAWLGLWNIHNKSPQSKNRQHGRFPKSLWRAVV